VVGATRIEIARDFDPVLLPSVVQALAAGGSLIPHGVEVFAALEPVDMRLGFDRLAGLAQERMQRSARSDALFLFFGKRKTALTLLLFDGSGLCIFTSGSTADASGCLRRWTTVECSCCSSASWTLCSMASTSSASLDVRLATRDRTDAARRLGALWARRDRTLAVQGRADATRDPECDDDSRRSH